MTNYELRDSIYECGDGCCYDYEIRVYDTTQGQRTLVGTYNDEVEALKGLLLKFDVHIKFGGADEETPF